MSSETKTKTKTVGAAPYLATIAAFIRPLYRPVNDKQVESLAASIKTRGFDPHFAVTFYRGKDFFSGEEGLVILGGEHRLRGCEKNSLTEVPAWEEHAPTSKTGQLRRAIQLNEHTQTDEGTLARQVMVYLQELASTGEALPKPEGIAADLGVSTSYVVRINAFRKRAAQEFVGAWLSNRKITLRAAEYITQNETRAMQRKRVCDNNFVVPSKENTGPLLHADQHGKVSHVAVVLGADAADVVVWLTGGKAESDAAFSRLSAAADAKYAADDAASLDTVGEVA